MFVAVVQSLRGFVVSFLHSAGMMTSSVPQSSSIEAKAILLQAIFPSLHPGVVEDAAASTLSVAHGARRCHRIAFPASTFGKELDDTTYETIRRAHHDYIRNTVVHGPQAADTSHRREYQQTVPLCRVNTDPWDLAFAEASTKRRTARFDDDHGIASRKSSVPSPLSSANVQGHPAPCWFGSVASGNRIEAKMIDEASSVRATAPVECYKDVFDSHDHKCSLVRELFLEGTHTFQTRWEAAAPHLIAGMRALVMSLPLVPSSMGTIGVEMTIPTFGRCVVRHDDILVRVLDIPPQHATVVPAAAAPVQQPGCSEAESHEPAASEPSASPSSQSHPHHRGQSAVVKAKHVKLKINPVRISIVQMGKNGDKPPSVIQANVSIKDVKLQLVGDVLLSPSGRHTMVIETAKFRIGSLSISTDRCGYNVVLWALSPIIRRLIQSEISSALVGKRSL